MHQCVPALVGLPCADGEDEVASLIVHEHVYSCARYDPPGRATGRYKPGSSVKCVTPFSRRTLIGRQDAGTLLYNIKEQHPSSHKRTFYKQGHHMRYMVNCLLCIDN